MDVRKIEVNGKEYQFVNVSKGNRSGFYHDSTLLVNGNERGHKRVQYYNRTWESYDFQTVMRRLISDLKQARLDNLRNSFKKANSYAKMNEKRNEEFTKETSNDAYLLELNEVYKALEKSL